MDISIHGINLHWDERGNGAPWLLLHGYGGSNQDWQHLFDLDELAQGRRLVMPDARGHGKSTDPEKAFSFRQCARDVRALLDHLRIERVRAVGVSLGAKTLLHVATRWPELVEAMVLVSPAPYLPENVRAVTGTPHDDLSFTPPHLATISARTLIVYGDRDPYYPVEMAVQLYRAIPRSQLWVLPNGEHTPVFGEWRADFERTTRAFLG
ncbi:alpha/beta fold hydrolase [Pendulispora brunnea]|uniref:Alpha/beta fold hydrolase n=1 Tax=Pendulispora brunnea TaxID=2905690 RepID=A0ABZ2K2F3_9BACT